MNLTEIEKKIKENGGRITKSRLKMIEIFINEPTTHFTIEELTQLLEKKHEYNTATIYNNLAMLVENGIVAEFSFNHKKHYELRGKMHAHFICECCQEIENVDIPGLGCFAYQIEKKNGARVLSNSIDFHGCCKKCQEKHTFTTCSKKDENGEKC